MRWITSYSCNQGGGGQIRGLGVLGVQGLGYLEEVMLDLLAQRLLVVALHQRVLCMTYGLSEAHTNTEGGAPSSKEKLALIRCAMDEYLWTFFCKSTCQPQLQARGESKYHLLLSVTPVSWPACAGIPSSAPFVPCGTSPFTTATENAHTLLVVSIPTESGKLEGSNVGGRADEVMNDLSEIWESGIWGFEYLGI